MNKNGKRYISLLIAMLMMVGMMCNTTFAASKSSGKCGKNTKWKYNKKTGTLTISGKGAMKNYDLYWEDDDDEDGSYVPWLKIKYIKKVIVKKGVSSIGDNAFSECEKLKSISIPSGVKSIGTDAFRLCPIQTLSLPEGVEKIGAGAFLGCEYIQTVVFPKSLKRVGEYAFAGCYNLSSIRVKSRNTIFEEDSLSVHDAGDEDESESWRRPEHLTIIGYTDSTAEQYAKKHSHSFVDVQDLTDLKETALTSVKAQKGSTVLVKWKTNSTGKGYELQYARNSSFTKDVRTNIIKQNETGKTTVQKLKKGTWYFRIRKTEGQQASVWSAVKRVRVK